MTMHTISMLFLARRRKTVRNVIVDSASLWIVFIEYNDASARIGSHNKTYTSLYITSLECHESNKVVQMMSIS